MGLQGILSRPVLLALGLAEHRIRKPRHGPNISLHFFLVDSQAGWKLNLQQLPNSNKQGNKKTAQGFLQALIDTSWLLNYKVWHLWTESLWGKKKHDLKAGMTFLACRGPGSVLDPWGGQQQHPCFPEEKAPEEERDLEVVGPGPRPRSKLHVHSLTMWISQGSPETQNQ